MNTPATDNALRAKLAKEHRAAALTAECTAFCQAQLRWAIVASLTRGTSFRTSSTELSRDQFYCSSRMLGVAKLEIM